MTPATSSTLPGSQQYAPSPGFFEWNTRIGRAHYVLFSCIAALPAILVMIYQADTQQHSAALAILVNVFSIAVGLMAAYRRLGDLDRSPWLAIAYILPLINAIMFIWLACSRGSAEATWCGEPPPPHGAGLTAMAIGMYLVLGAGVVCAVTLSSPAAFGS